jgi:hypothetical protein
VLLWRTHHIKLRSRPPSITIHATPHQRAPTSTPAPSPSPAHPFSPSPSPAPSPLPPLAHPQMTLVVVSTLPILAAASIIQNKFFTGFSSQADSLFSGANQIASEAIGSIRTIAAFSLQVPDRPAYSFCTVEVICCVLSRKIQRARVWGGRGGERRVLGAFGLAQRQGCRSKGTKH